jgi:flagellar motor switch protein FliM
MEPVLTQEELEAIYSAMQGGDLPSASVDDVALTAGQEFISRAETRWNEATKEMSSRIGAILTGALGKRVTVKLHLSEAICEDLKDVTDTDAMPLADGASVLIVGRVGDISVIFAIDLEIARRVVERRTGAKPTDDSDSLDKQLTALEKRLLKDLVQELVRTVSEATPYENVGEVAAIEADDIWSHRTRRELWVITGVGLGEYGNRGVRIAAPARLFVPMTGEAKQVLSRHLSSTPIVITAELGKFKTTVKKLWHMKPGELIPIGTTVGDPLNIAIGGIPKLLGEPLVSRGNISVRILNRIENGEGK